MSEEEELPRLLSGRYRLEGTLGHGGMGVVYRGTDLMMHRPIAVKLIRAVDGVELDEEIAGRFLREAKNTARLQHEHIIEVFDLGRTDEGGLYFVMELLEGESLSARLRREGQLSPATVVHIGRQICEALHVAHTAGVVHRDLKPANIMLLSRAGDDDFVKVLDFGVAKSTMDNQDTQLTHTGMLVGTVDYMAPEQIMGKTVDGRTDVYALGVVLYKMLSGIPPFRDTGVPALIHAHINTMPKPLIEVSRGIPNELDHVVLRCLAKSPERRFESMAELARALTQAVMPESAELLDLEYGGRSEDDVYGGGDMTAVGRPLADSGRGLRRSMHDPLPADDATVNERVIPRVGDDADAPNEMSFEDATVKMDRPSAPKPGQGFGAPQGAMAAYPLPRAPMYPADVATAKRSRQDEVTRFDRSEPRPCAMCQTVNAPHVRMCVACGVSLANDDQDAVRARVLAGAPRTASAPAPPMPPVSTGERPAYEMGRRGPMPSHHPSGPYGVPSPLHGVPVPHPGHGYGEAPGWIPHQPPPRQAPPPSMWQRFLTWTGLRSR
jgi:serine/threonine protein kinase